jgi:hypothetical protein
VSLNVRQFRLSLNIAYGALVEYDADAGSFTPVPKQPFVFFKVRFFGVE